MSVNITILKTNIFRNEGSVEDLSSPNQFLIENRKDKIFAKYLQSSMNM